MDLHIQTDYAGEGKKKASANKHLTSPLRDATFKLRRRTDYLLEFTESSLRSNKT